MRSASVFAGLVLVLGVDSAASDCSRIEYTRSYAEWDAFCRKIGFGATYDRCTVEDLASANSQVEWVLSNEPAAEAYQAAVAEQIACGYPTAGLTFLRAMVVAAKQRDESAQCAIFNCSLPITLMLDDLDQQGKLPKP